MSAGRAPDDRDESRRAIAAGAIATLAALTLPRERAVAELPELPIPLPDTEARVGLGRALGGLSRQMRAVVVLRYLDDRPVAEVASLLGIAEGTDKAYTHRALAELHDVLQPVTGGDR